VEGEMSQQDAEEAAHAQARALVTGDIGAAVRQMTPEALAKAMAVGNTTWTVTAYDLASPRRDGDDYLFDVCLDTDVGPLTLRERFREIDGEWKMVDIQRIDSSPAL
jgi:hypothetical protein